MGYNKKSSNRLEVQPQSKSKKRPYRIVKKIGSGAFGEVYLARMRNTNEHVAVKKTFQDPKFANREEEMSRKLNHPNIVKFHDISLARKNGRSYLILVMDYFPTSLQNIIDQNQKRSQWFTEQQFKTVAQQILMGLAYMHSQSVVHRDIKPDNILIDIKNAHVVLADFGSAKNVKDGSYNKSYICSRVYRAPELVLGCENYTELVDVWSVGCVLAECILGDPLFPARSNGHLMRLVQRLFGKLDSIESSKLKRGDLSGVPVSHKNQGALYSLKTKSKTILNDQFIEFLTGTLEVDPQVRCSAQDSLCHPWFFSQAD